MTSSQNLIFAIICIILHFSSLKFCPLTDVELLLYGLYLHADDFSHCNLHNYFSQQFIFTYLWRKYTLSPVNFVPHSNRVRTGYGVMVKLWNFEKEIPYMEKLWNLSKTAVPMEKLWNFRFGGKNACFLNQSGGGNTSGLRCGFNVCCLGYHFTSFTNLPGYSASLLLGRVNTC